MALYICIPLFHHFLQHLQMFPNVVQAIHSIPCSPKSIWSYLYVSGLIVSLYLRYLWSSGLVRLVVNVCSCLVYLVPLITLLSFHFMAVDSRDEDCGCSRSSGIILWHYCGSHLVVSPKMCPDYKVLSLVLEIHLWSLSDSLNPIFNSLSSSSHHSSHPGLVNWLDFIYLVCTLYLQSPDSFQNLSFTLGLSSYPFSAYFPHRTSWDESYTCAHPFSPFNCLGFWSTQSWHHPISHHFTSPTPHSQDMNSRVFSLRTLLWTSRPLLCPWWIDLGAQFIYCWHAFFIWLEDLHLLD